jgi:hypothetical protein
MGATDTPDMVVLAKGNNVLIRLDAVQALVRWRDNGDTYLWAYTADGTCTRLFDFAEADLTGTGLFTPWLLSNDLCQYDVDDDFFADWDDNDDLMEVAFRRDAVEVLHSQHAREDDKYYPYQFVLASGERHNCFSLTQAADMAAAVMPDGDGPFPNMDMACKVLDDGMPCWTSCFRARDVECTTSHKEDAVSRGVSFLSVYMRCGEYLRVFVTGDGTAPCAMRFFNAAGKRRRVIRPASEEEPEPKRARPDAPVVQLKPIPALPVPSLGDVWGNFCQASDAIQCECPSAWATQAPFTL